MTQNPCMILLLFERIWGLYKKLPFVPFIASHMSEFLKFCFLTISLKQNFISHTELDSLKSCHEHSERALQCVRSKKPNGLRSNGGPPAMPDATCDDLSEQRCIRTPYALLLFYRETAPD